LPSTCLFTNTPTQDFLIDRVDGITLVSACSGRGAKFAPVIREFAVSTASGDGSIPDQFRVNAFCRIRPCLIPDQLGPSEPA
jgi:sarcosine oxidase